MKLNIDTAIDFNYFIFVVLCSWTLNDFLWVYFKLSCTQLYCMQHFLLDVAKWNYIVREMNVSLLEKCLPKSIINHTRSGHSKNLENVLNLEHFHPLHLMLIDIYFYDTILCVACATKLLFDTQKRASFLATSSAHCHHRVPSWMIVKVIIIMKHSNWKVLDLAHDKLDSVSRHGCIIIYTFDSNFSLIFLLFVVTDGFSSHSQPLNTAFQVCEHTHKQFT